jgi:predicted Zn-dependent peptidase
LILVALLIATLPQVTAPGPGGRTTSGDGSASSTVRFTAPAGDPFTPSSVVSVPSGPRVALLPARGSPVVAIRLSVALDEAPSEAGSAHMLHVLGSERARSRAAALGVRVEGARTPWGLAYTVAGSRADFDLLASLIAEAVAEPSEPEETFQTQRRALRNQLLRTQETPGARVLAELQGKAVPGAGQLDGTPASLDRITRVGLRDFWRRTHRPTAMTVVVAGDVPDEQLFSAFDGLGAPRGSAARPTGIAPSAAAAPTQTFRHWYGEAFAIPDPLNPHPSVVALLAAEQLRSMSDSLEASVQLSESKGGTVLAVVAAAYPASANRMRTRVAGLLASVRQGATPGRVQAATSRVRQDLLERGRTPAGLVDLVGSLMDATGEPGAARKLLSALDAVTLESTRTFLGQLSARTPLRAEVRP